MDSSSAAQRQPPRIPDHDLLRCIGRGSYGEVWLARSRMGAYRAVKIVERKSFRDDKPFQRELSGIRKFEPISRSHEGFIDILHVGIDEERGYFFYVMELGDDQASGQTIDVANYSPKTLAKEISKRRHFTWKESLELGLALSQALAELHKRGLVHRDVKPSNIIFVNGVPKLADIGLVAEIDEARSFVGTEGYIPPEGPGTPQADVYGLGKVLYEASTGLDRLNFPELPEYWETFPDRQPFLELNEIILHSCSNDLNRRYQSAWEMYAELVILANGKSVKRLHMLERRLAQFKRSAFALAIALLVLGPLAYQVYRERNLAREARQRQVGANIAYGNRALESGDLSGALPYYAEAFRLDEAEPKAESLHRLRSGSVLSQCPKLVQMWFDPKRVDVASVSPDGQSVLIVEYFGQARIFNILTGKPVTPPFGQASRLRQGAFDSAGRRVVTASEDGTASIWDANDGHLIQAPFEHHDIVYKAVFSPDGERILTACRDRKARIINLKTGEVERTLDGPTDAVLSARYSSDGRRIVTGSRDTFARIYDAATGELIGKPLPHPLSWVYDAGFSADGRQVITSCNDHRAHVWDVESGTLIQPDLIHHDLVWSAEFSPDSRFILTGCLDGTAQLWDARTHRPLPINPILRHSDRVTYASFARDGHRFVTSCVDGTVRMWDLAGTLVAPIPTHATFSEDGSRFLTLSNEQFQVFDTVSNRPVCAPIQPPSTLAKATLSSEGAFAITLTTNSSNPQMQLQVWSVSTAQPRGPGLLLTNQPAILLLSTNGSILLSLDNFTVQTWDVDSGNNLSCSANVRSVTSAVLNAVGTVAATWGGTDLNVFSTRTGQNLFPPIKHPFPITHAEFSRNGSRLVSCFAEPTFIKCFAQVWDAQTGQPLGPPLRHQDGVIWASFSQDATRVATTGEDSTTAIWEIPSGRPIAEGLQHETPSWSAILNPSATLLATAGSDQTARIWSGLNGAPLTPPLFHLQSLRTVRFLASDTVLFTLDKIGDGSVWTLPIETRSPDDVAGIARLLCGGKINPAFGLSSAPMEPLETLWNRLRSKFPDQFRTSPAETAAWHRFQAEQSDQEHNPVGAAFHWNQLLQLRPDDPLAKKHCSDLKPKR